MKPKAHHICHILGESYSNRDCSWRTECLAALAILDVFVDRYYYYCFKRKREGACSSVNLHKFKPVRCWRWSHKRGCRLSHSNIWFHMAVLHEKDFHLENEAKWPPSPTPALISLMSPVCTFSVLFKCNIAPYCAMINIWAYNYHGIESYKSIWVLYTNIIALLLCRNQAIKMGNP